MADKPFAIHVDESMYHSKVRLEFWVIHFVKQIRRVRYLTTIELKTNFDVSAFLTSDSSLKSLDDVKLVSSKMYKDEQSSLQEVEKSDNKKHVEVLVFKRKADKALDRELQEAGKELAEAEIAFVQAKKSKQELEAMKSGVIARRDNVSDEIISSMFS